MVMDVLVTFRWSFPVFPSSWRFFHAESLCSEILLEQPGNRMCNCFFRQYLYSLGKRGDAPSPQVWQPTCRGKKISRIQNMLREYLEWDETSSVFRGKTSHRRINETDGIWWAETEIRRKKNKDGCCDQNSRAGPFSILLVCNWASNHNSNQRRNETFRRHVRNSSHGAAWRTLLRIQWIGIMIRFLRAIIAIHRWASKFSDFHCDGRSFSPGF